jgi:hypothetical protein
LPTLHFFFIVVVRQPLTAAATTKPNERDARAKD